MTRSSPESRNTYVVSRGGEDDRYGLWRLDLDAPQLLVRTPIAPDARFDRRGSLIQIGGYLLSWSAIQDDKSPSPYFEYRLFEFDPASADPLARPTVQQGVWLKSKFWGQPPDFGNPGGGHKQFDESKDLFLIPLGSYLLNFIPTRGRGTFYLWNFDPCPTAPNSSVDPVAPFGVGIRDAGASGFKPYGSFRTMQQGDQLIPMNGYVLDRKTATGEFAVYVFDPQAIVPLPNPPLRQGTWPNIGPERRLVGLGEHVLDWNPDDGSYRLWLFDGKSEDPLTGPVCEGVLPAELHGDFSLTPITTKIPADESRPAAPGTIDFMRSKIEHIVYYMIENRSFDHAVGWLYEKDPSNVRVIGPAGPYDGASTSNFNLDEKGQKVFQSKYQGGRLSDDFTLEMFDYDPYHDNSDTLRQMFSVGGYGREAEPDMGGFVVNNSSPVVMQSFSPEQLPVLNGLAKNFAVSDAWFCSMPACTDVNRAFALTGSSMMQLNNFMSPPQYDYWPEQIHRASIWKVLWANGFTDFKIYNSTTWMSYVFSYQLFLEGQIPTVDKNVAGWVSPFEQFKADALAGKLPAFSFVEPVWIAPSGTTSYHPGADVVPAERQLNDLYDAIRKGPGWDKTLLVITFDEHGGIYDHAPPPRAENPWPQDEVDGFRFDRLGVRIPTMLVSPWIDENTVFRSGTGVAYDSTSILATLLDWAGIPRSRWFLGERTKRAPTFEQVLARATPRADSPTFVPPHDKNYPESGPPTPNTKVLDLHRQVAHRAIVAMAAGKLPPAEVRALTARVLADATDTTKLTRSLEELKTRLG